MILLFTIFLCSLALGNGDTHTYTHHMVLHDPEYQMFWKFDETDITIKLKVKTTGWIGWGLSPNGGMKGADMIIAWLDGKGKHFDDYFCEVPHVQPKKDENQDYQLIDMYETDGWLTTIFKRKIKLLDAEDITITESTMRIIYSWGESDPLSEDNIPYHHIRRGTRSAYLLDHRDQAREKLPDDHKTFDMLMTNFQVPTEDTSYWCKIIKMPDMGSKKQHLIRIDPVITQGNEGVVHHMVIYTCTKAAEEDVNVQHSCTRRNMPSRYCKTIMTHAWAVGGGPFYYPQNAGLPLNTADDPKYYLLEIHYDNPGGLTNIVDNSGLRLYYTEELRQYDSTILSVGIAPGQDESQIIPQQQESFTSYGFCPSACLPANKKFYIYAYALHTHLAGRKIVVRLIDPKTGKQKRVIAQDLTYDFNYQTTRYIKDPIEITPGHQIDVDCTYNTMNREDPLLGGLSTSDEMCLAFLYVYPSLDISQCYSMSGSTYSWGARTYGWDVNPVTGRFNKPIRVAGKTYDGHSYIPLRDKEFWSDKIGNKSLIKSYEKLMLSEMYQYECKYRRGIKEKEGIMLNKQRLMEDDGEKEKKKTSDSNGLRPFSVFFFFPAFLLYFNLQ